MPLPVQMLLDFTGRTVIVTGGGSGLGAGLATRFAEAGAQVALSYNASEQGANEIVERIEASGGRAIAIRADLTLHGDAARLVARTVEAFHRLDVLINNAGAYPLHPLLEMSEDDWDTVVNANLRSTFLCTQIAARQMIEQETKGAIVNVSTIEAENPAPMHSHYNAAKAGVAMFTRSAASELGPHGIRVNSVSPGLIWREGIEQQWPEGVQRWQRTAPLKRLGLPHDVADACLFLASSAARWITGADLRVDGGVMTHQIY